MFTIFTVKNKDYQCRMNVRACIEAEKKLKQNPLNVFTACENGGIPSFQDMIIILHASMVQQHHNISITDVADLVETYTEDHGGIVAVVELIVGLFKDSGLLGKETTQKK